MKDGILVPDFLLAEKVIVLFFFDRLKNFWNARRREVVGWDGGHFYDVELRVAPEIRKAEYRGKIV